MRFEVRHVAGALGAELSGVDLTSMNDADIGDLRALIHEHEVVFFREVWLTEEQHLTLGTLLARRASFRYLGCSAARSRPFSGSPTDRTARQRRTPGTPT